jgi:hypothetical protein
MLRNKCTNTQSRNSEGNSDLQPNTVTVKRRLVSTHRPYFTPKDTFRPPHKTARPQTASNHKFGRLQTSYSIIIHILHNAIELSLSLSLALPPTSKQPRRSPLQAAHQQSFIHSFVPSFLPSFNHELLRAGRSQTEGGHTRPDRPCHSPGSRKKYNYKLARTTKTCTKTAIKSWLQTRS